jgi:hypothetical protein
MNFTNTDSLEKICLWAIDAQLDGNLSEKLLYLLDDDVFELVYKQTFLIQILIFYGQGEKEKRKSSRKRGT